MENKNDLETKLDEVVLKSAEKTRKLAMLLVMLTITFIPTYGQTFSTNDSGHPITETIYMWPWMVLILLQPMEGYVSEQYVINGFPWTLLFFVPFLYVFKIALELYFEGEDKQKKNYQIMLGAALQIIIIAGYFASNPETDISRKIWYLPELILILVSLVLVIKWR